MTAAGRLAFTSLAFLVMASVGSVDAQAPKALRPAALDGEADSSLHGSGGVPQLFVVCTGWHALCSDDVKYEWVSTYSYRGWCSLLALHPRPCDQSEEGYTGDLYWAVCDAAPCTEIQNPTDPDKPLSCRCRVKSTPFVGVNDSCTGQDGGIISSFEPSAWDFENNTYTIPMPGHEYVQGACATLTSDPPEEPRRDGESR